MIDVYVTHYVREGLETLNDTTAAVVREIMAVTPTACRMTVVGWSETDELWADLEAKVGATARILRNDRP